MARRCTASPRCRWGRMTSSRSSRIHESGAQGHRGQRLGDDEPQPDAAHRAGRETITVVGDSPPILTTSSSVGQVVDLTRIERLPLNGRQFANLAATVPGVGIGFHSDPTKSTQVHAADQRRQRTQHQLRRRRRRQQRRYRRRPAAALSARGHPTVQCHHAPLRRAVRAQRRRRAECRHQERHQRHARQRVHAVPRQRRSTPRR